MLKKVLRNCLVLTIVALCYGAMSAFAGNAGDSEAVKGVPARDFESARKSSLPLCVYFYDKEATDRVVLVKLFEERVLADADLKDKLKRFTYLKIRNNGTDVKGWPVEFRSRADKTAALMLATSDLKEIVFFDKNSPKEEVSLEVIANTVTQILAYEDKKRGVAPAGDKTTATKANPTPPVPEKTIADAKVVPGLADKKDPKDAKKPDKKVERDE